MNVQAICRVCLNKNSDMISIFDSYSFSSVQNCEIFKVIIECASVQIQEFDGFSVKICRRCLIDLSQAYNFKKLCEDSDYKFRNNLIASDIIEIKSEFYEEDSKCEIHETDLIAVDDYDIKSEFYEENSVINYGEIHNDKENTDEKTTITEITQGISCTSLVLPKITVNNISLPENSRDAYEKEFQRFDNWCRQNNVATISENILLLYFEALSKKKKSSTLWTTYSMLRSCLNIFKNLDITNYIKLQAFLKASSAGYETKKSKILEAEDIDRFIQKADDTLYLAMKIVLIMGYNGGCRRNELTSMLVDDIDFKSNVIVVTIPKTQHNVARIFSITNKEWVDLVKKYSNLRPKHTSHRRFFLTYRNGHCLPGPIGINTMGKMPKLIANYLKLPNPDLFTGHCFRRSCNLANKNSSIVILKHHGGGKSLTLSDGHIEVAQMLSGHPSTSSDRHDTKTS